MAITSTHAPDQAMLVLGVTSTVAEPVALMTDLNFALDKIEASLEQRDIYFRAIDLSGKWKLSDGEFDPEREDFVFMWRATMYVAELFDPMHTWLTRIEKLIKMHDNEIWESETAQLGEVAASVFALSQSGFVADYVRLLETWDLGHAVAQPVVIDQILSNHGDIPEAHDLLRIKNEWGF